MCDTERAAFRVFIPAVLCYDDDSSLARFHDLRAFDAFVALVAVFLEIINRPSVRASEERGKTLRAAADFDANDTFRT